MPTCFLKRVLPFALTLMVGLMLGTFLKSGNVQPNRSVVPQPSGSISESRYFRPSEVDQKARTLFRAEPQYTYEARENAVTGTVVLRAVFSASGEVTNIRVVSGLPDGLTERAVEAARGIKFTPAIKDGRAVSQYIQIEYNFNLY